MASGKQILLSLLSEYSQRKVPETEIDLVSERLKAGLLLHGSSSNAMWKMTDQIAWVNVINETEGQPSYLQAQGLGLKNDGPSLSALFELMAEGDSLPKAVKEAYPDISAKRYKAGVHMIGLLLKSLEWASVYETVENGGVLDEQEKEQMLKAYQRKLAEYRANPKDYS